MGLRVARRTRWLWSDDEKRSIRFQTTETDVSVARGYGLDDNLIFKWLRDPRFAPRAGHSVADMPCLFPFVTVRHATHEAAHHPVAEGQIAVELAGWHRLRISGSYDNEALARLNRSPSG